MRRLLIGIGNPFRRDDGVGIQVAEKILASHPAEVEIQTQSGEGTKLMESWMGVERVVIVDAVRSRSTPGRIHEFDAGQVRVPSEFFHYSSHAFGVAEAIELSRALEQLPPQVHIIGIEGEDFSEGTGLTMEVEEAIEKAVARVKSLLKGSPQ